MQVAIRVEGGERIGLGHLGRMQVLGRELLRRGHDVTFLTRRQDQARRFLPDGATMTDEIRESLRSGRFDCTVMDLPSESNDCSVTRMDIDTQQLFADLSNVLVLFEDDLDKAVCGDLLFNGHIYGTPDRFEWIGQEPKWCLGGEYMIFDDKIRQLSKRKRSVLAIPERAVVTIGGSDVTGSTPLVLRTLAEYDIETTIIIGPAFAADNRTTIRETADEVDSDVRLMTDPDNLKEILAESDFAVTALGYTAYDLLAVGTPFVGLQTAPDQALKADALAEENAALVLEEISREALVAQLKTIMDPERRQTLIDRGQELVNPNGTVHVCKEIENLVKES